MKWDLGLECINIVYLGFGIGLMMTGPGIWMAGMYVKSRLMLLLVDPSENLFTFL